MIKIVVLNTIQWNNSVMDDTTARENSSNRSLERALFLLLTMEQAGRSMTLTQLSLATQLPKPTVQRLLSVLEKYGFSEKRQSRYHLGINVLPLAYSYLLGNELTVVALPVLLELAQTSEETASLFVRSGFQRVLVQRVTGRYPLRFVLPIGQRLPLHMGNGKVLAAAMSDSEVKRMLEKVGDFQRANGEWVTPKKLLTELDKIRHQGYAISRNERVMGNASVAAPVIDANGVTIASVAVTGHTDRQLTLKRLEKLSLEVRAAAKAIANRYEGGSCVS
jgi:DNA-binding IclR family transcriptional regulator